MTLQYIFEQACALRVRRKSTGRVKGSVREKAPTTRLFTYGI